MTTDNSTYSNDFLSSLRNIPVVNKKKTQVTLKSILGEDKELSVFDSIKTNMSQDIVINENAEYPGTMRWSEPNITGYKSIDHARKAYGNMSGGADAQLTEWSDLFKQIRHTVTIKQKLTFQQDPDSKQNFAKLLGKYFSFTVNKQFIGLDEKNIIETSLKFDESEEDNTLTSVTISSRNLDVFKKIKAIFAEYMILQSNGGSITIIDSVSVGGIKTHDAQIEDDEKFSNTTFYPWMQGTSIEEYFSDFMQSDANLMVLYGPPGTAKTTMVKTAIKKLGLSTVMSANAHVTSDGGFVTGLIQYLEVERPGTDLVLLEDADALIRPREDGNLGLNALLSFLDGIGSTDVKLVIITNKENTENIDTALLRHGRCYDIMEFGRLKLTEANLARKSVGLPPLPTTVFKSMTLAQALVDNGRDSVRSSRNENHSIVSPRFPIAKGK